ncbi:hypothetical protein TIFTF001_031120 [Ficus carica]|uniref:Uncharacterized protein n=1 Tax=Ficus carica TaxID=3494 RepID=A0AA88DUP5_FICCA|nr:hypothetical protein TIFTF001_031120 [Ficus carica]
MNPIDACDGLSSCSYITQLAGSRACAPSPSRVYLCLWPFFIRHASLFSVQQTDSRHACVGPLRMLCASCCGKEKEKKRKEKQKMRLGLESGVLAEGVLELEKTESKPRGEKPEQEKKRTIYILNE